MADKTDIAKIITADNIDFKAAVTGLGDFDFAKLASLLGVPLLPDATRDELNAEVVAAIELRRDRIAQDLAAQEAKKAADEKQAAFLKTAAGKAHRQAIEDRSRNAAVRSVHAAFANALPSDARQTGSFKAPADHPQGDQPSVPDGTYRVLGTDWLHRFKRGQWIGADRAAPQAKPIWTEIPDNAASDPEIPAAANG